MRDAACNSNCCSTLFHHKELAGTWDGKRKNSTRFTLACVFVSYLMKEATPFLRKLARVLLSVSSSGIYDVAF
eukprot:symbB.v1.2.006728.t1/scaffold402.1/size211320/22